MDLTDLISPQESSTSQEITEHGVLHLCLPVTPSANSILGWAWSQSSYLSIFKREAASAVWTAVTIALGSVPRAKGTYWAECATLGIVRCSRGRRRIDDDNIVGGCKYHRDALIKTGVLIDDNPGRLTMTYPVEDRVVGAWGLLHGPATHFFVKKEEKKNG